MFRSSILTIGLMSLCTMASAQWPGVLPVGATDAEVAQVRASGPVTVRTKTWKVDYSRHTADKGELLSVVTTSYDAKGRVVASQTFDNTDVRRSFTSYVYDGDRLMSWAQYTELEHDLVFQTFYTYESDSVHMRFTDGFQTVISRTSARCAADEVWSVERFADGEEVTRRFTYDSEHRLVRTLQTATDGMATETKLKVGSDGLPSKGVMITPDGKKHPLAYTYEKDPEGNWTKRVTTVDGVPESIVEREVMKESDEM